MIRITKTCDLLEAKPVEVMIRDYGKSKVMDVVSKAVTKCAFSLGIELNHLQIETIAEDLIDKFSLDSVEDIIECLRKGRKGNYGTTYNKMNTIVISDWMSQHLEEKSAERERILKDMNMTTGEGQEFYEKYAELSVKREIEQDEKRVVEIMKEADQLINKKLQ